MALVQEIKDGKVVDSSASQSKKTDTDSKSNTYDKEMFLKLLVAEMQYQDPLEPTSNTEYVSELASFQIEAVLSLPTSASASLSARKRSSSFSSDLTVSAETNDFCESVIAS